MKSKNNSKKARLRKGSLNEIIVLAKKKYSFPDLIIICTQAIIMAMLDINNPWKMLNHI
jgi:hypothetical protein